MILFNHTSDRRCTVLADYLLDNKATVRSTAAYFSISKSTVHKDLTEKLMRENPAKYEEVRQLLELNKATRHIRGGEATRKKYLQNRISQEDS